VIVVVVLAILAITLGVELANNLGKKKAASPTTSSTASATALVIKSAHDFDPPPGNGSENPQQVPDAYDGDQASAWSTLDYTTPDVGGKKGVGLVFDLGSVVAIGRVQLQTSLPGWNAEIRVADQEGATAADYRIVKPITAGTGITTVMLPAQTRARYVLLWITQLVNNNTNTKFPYSATVNEIRFYAS